MNGTLESFSSYAPSGGRIRSGAKALGHGAGLDVFPHSEGVRRSSTRKSPWFQPICVFQVWYPARIPLRIPYWNNNKTTALELLVSCAAKTRYQ